MKRLGRLLIPFSGLIFAVGLLWVLSPRPPWAVADQDAMVSHPVVLGDGDIVLRALTAGDLDGDGDLDLVSTGLLAWENPSTSFPSKWTSTTLASGVDAWDVTLGDLDRDGDLDAVAGGAFGLFLWQNPSVNRKTHGKNRRPSFEHRWKVDFRVEFRLFLCARSS